MIPPAPVPVTAASIPFLSPKQHAFLLAPDRRLNFLVGSIRSGKTEVSLWKWALFVASCPKEYEFLMVGKTITSLKRNCLGLLQKKVGRRNFKFNLTTKEGVLFGRKVHLEGANDERSDEKIQGATLGGAYVDEITTTPESFVRMLLGRLSLPGAKLYATCNPEYPKHYIKTGFIDKQGELDIAVWEFLLDDNIFLDGKYKDSLKKEYAGTVFYNRFILGRWCQAEGVIYPTIAAKPELVVVDKIDYSAVKFAIIGVDFGGHRSGDAFVCVGYTDSGVVVLDEEYIKGIKTPAQLDASFVSFVKRQKAKGLKIYEAFADSAEQTLKAGLEAASIKEKMAIDVRNALKGRIIDRIALVNTLVAHGRFKIMRHCQEVIGAFQQAIWDGKKQEDTRLDDGKTVNIDVLDATEYAMETMAEAVIADCYR